MHGVRGEVRLMPFAPDVALPACKSVRVRLASGEVRELELASAREVHEGYLVAFVGYLDRDLAQALRGAHLAVPKTALPHGREAEAYVFELLGAAVEDVEGAVLGTVGAVLGNAGQDLLRIDTPTGERLLPMVADTMRGFDRARRVLTVQLIPGLWDEA